MSNKSLSSLPSKSLKDCYRSCYTYYDRAHKVYLSQIATFGSGEDIKKAMLLVLSGCDMHTLATIRNCELHPVAWWNTTRNIMCKPSTDSVVVDLKPLCDAIIKEYNK